MGRPPCHPGLSKGPWLPDQRGQKPSLSVQPHYTFGSDYRLSTWPPHFVPRQSQQDSTSNIGYPIIPLAGPDEIGNASRLDGVHVPDDALGTSSLPHTSVGTSALSIRHSIQTSPQDNSVTTGSTVTVLVDPRIQSNERRSLPGSTTHPDNIRCQLIRLGSHMRQAGGSRHMVSSGVHSADQFPRTACSSSGPQALRDLQTVGSGAGQNRQRVGQILFEPSGGHTLPPSSEGGLSALPVGREQCRLDSGRISQGRGQQPSGLAQSGKATSRGMDSSPRGFSSDSETFWPHSCGPLCHQAQSTGEEILLPVCDTRRGRDGCLNFPVASGQTVCLSSDSSYSQGDQKASDREIGTPISGSMVATETLVSSPSRPVGGTTMADSSTKGPTLSGTAPPPGSRVVGASCMELERRRLLKKGISPQVLETMMASRRPSTLRIYESTWKAFSSWSQKKGILPRKAGVNQILSFLQDGLSLGLRPNTLKRQVLALSAILSRSLDNPIGSHPFIKRFLRGATVTAPPTVRHYPTWDLHKVLSALQRPPFEPLSQVSLRLLSFKVLFLVAITSARRVSELNALSVHKNFCMFHKNRVVLHNVPSFHPKVLSTFHCQQELVLPSFCPNPVHPLEKAWHSLDVRRALKVYISKTKPIQKTDNLFVSFHPTSLGNKVSTSTLARWIKACISLAYASLRLPHPTGVVAHSTRAAATSAAFSRNAPLAEICRAATWSTPNTFIKHYKIDSYASSEAAFGRRVLQHILKDHS
ncbi:uncharacterized protein LOC133380355 [Rhineura floridana]|uniref:uncharacterized protein LOC133380355 n=1 Tax=Rhineura floridana TaxID=261503 RepID=UPI002AC803F7|nr:uncharacterized protein LOC133380355 [Rhineura floridana]